MKQERSPAMSWLGASGARRGGRAGLSCGRTLLCAASRAVSGRSRTFARAGRHAGVDAARTPLSDRQQPERADRRARRRSAGAGRSAECRPGTRVQPVGGARRRGFDADSALGQLGSARAFATASAPSATRVFVSVALDDQRRSGAQIVMLATPARLALIASSTGAMNNSKAFGLHIPVTSTAQRSSLQSRKTKDAKLTRAWATVLFEAFNQPAAGAMLAISALRRRRRLRLIEQESDLFLLMGGDCAPVTSSRGFASPPAPLSAKEGPNRLANGRARKSSSFCQSDDSCFRGFRRRARRQNSSMRSCVRRSTG